MHWEQSSPMDQKTQFVSEYLRDTISFTELCDRYGISRKTSYKLIDRYQAEGPAGLADRSRRPHSSPDETPEPLVSLRYRGAGEKTICAMPRCRKDAKTKSAGASSLSASTASLFTRERL